VKKYKLTNETIELRGRTLYRIKALIDFNDVKKGDLGGYVEREENLSHRGDCWIYGNAQVYGYAQVFGNAKALGDILLCGRSYSDGSQPVLYLARNELGFRLDTNNLFNRYDFIDNKAMQLLLF